MMQVVLRRDNRALRRGGTALGAADAGVPGTARILKGAMSQHTLLY
jgi:hypothetical protein